MKEIANLIIEELKKYDFVISTYYSYSTSSIYIKLDYGVANGIRIADHKGKKKYKYRYNVVNDLQKDYSEIDEGYERFYFRTTSIKDLVAKIVSDKQAKQYKYGLNNYNLYMERMKNEEVNKRFKEVG